MKKIGICCEVKMCKSVSCYDFFEFPASEIASMSTEQFRELLLCSYKVPVMNRLFPSSIRLVGEINLNEIRAYTKLVFERGVALGTSLFVLGSGKSRSYMSDSDRSRAMQDFELVCAELDVIAQEYGVCKGTSNLLTSLEETYEFLKKRFSSIKMIADFYHMSQACDDHNDLMRYASQISHIHICDESRGIIRSQSSYIKKLLDVAVRMDDEVLWSVEVNQIECEQARKMYNFLKQF